MGSSTSTLGKKSSAQEVVALLGSSLKGKTALVTGAASGIGLETVKAFTSAGCRVLATARDVGAAERIIAAEFAGGPSANTPYTGDVSLVKVLPLDLERLSSIRALAAAAEAEAPEGLDFCVLNAGIMALPELATTPCGFEKQIGTNHFGHHLLVSLLRPALVARTSKPARIVYLSSLAHNRGNVDVADLHFSKGRKYTPWGAYGQSKKANMLEARELADQLRTEAPHITVASVHPGVIATNLGRHMTMLNNPVVVRGGGLSCARPPPAHFEAALARSLEPPLPFSPTAPDFHELHCGQEYRSGCINEHVCVPLARRRERRILLRLRSQGCGRGGPGRGQDAAQGPVGGHRGAAQGSRGGALRGGPEGVRRAGGSARGARPFSNTHTHTHCT